jgi:hypothetical protein
VVSLEDELSAAAAAAGAFVGEGEELVGVVAAEPARGLRVYLCAYRCGGALAWLLIDASGEAIADRALVRDAVSVVGLCEVAEESAGGGHLEELREQLLELKASEAPEGIDEALRSTNELARAILEPPRVASLDYLDAIGAAASALERSLGEMGTSPFAAAMRSGSGAVEGLTSDVEGNYKRPLG